MPKKEKLIKLIEKTVWNLKLYIIFVVVTTLIFSYVISNYTFNAFKGLVQDFIDSPDAISFLYLGTLLDLLIIFYYIILVIFRKFAKHKKAQNIWLEVTIILIVLSLIAGSFFLLGFMSHDLSSVLRDSKNAIIGEINCTDSSGRFLANSTVNCTVIQPDLLAFSVKIQFTLINGTTILIDQNDSISFISPYDTKRVEFNIFGIDKNFNEVSLSTGRDFEFYTESQYTERNGQFLTYLAGLIVIILITIPSAMSNFKSLCEK